MLLLQARIGLKLVCTMTNKETELLACNRSVYSNCEKIMLHSTYHQSTHTSQMVCLPIHKYPTDTVGLIHPNMIGLLPSLQFWCPHCAMFCKIPTDTNEGQSPLWHSNWRMHPKAYLWWPFLKCIMLFDIIRDWGKLFYAHGCKNWLTGHSSIIAGVQKSRLEVRIKRNLC